jgi:predicted O-methyltransferase YrrM
MTINLSTILDAPRVDAILAEREINGFDAGGGTDKQTTHSYGPVYEALLEKFATKPCTFLEVGVNAGGSMLLWYDLCEQSRVIGVDCSDVVHPSVFKRMEDSRYVFMVGDGYAPSTAEMVQQFALDGLDFAVDDGPHTLQSQCEFLRLYVPMLKPGGVAVVEDIQAESWFEPLIGCVKEGFSVERVDRRAIKGRYDDLMLIVRHD